MTVNPLGFCQVISFYFQCVLLNGDNASFVCFCCGWQKALLCTLTIFHSLTMEQFIKLYGNSSNRYLIDNWICKCQAYIRVHVIRTCNGYKSMGQSNSFMDVGKWPLKAFRIDCIAYWLMTQNICQNRLMTQDTHFGFWHITGNQSVQCIPCYCQRDSTRTWCNQYL